MKKIIIIPIVIIAAAIPAVPYFIGTSVEKTFRNEIEQASSQGALSGAQVELVSYQRGIFSASAETSFTYQNPNGKDKLTFNVTHHIDHTPHPLDQVLATVDSKLQPNGSVQELLSPLFKELSPIQVTTRVYIDGHQEGTVFSPAVTGQLDGAKAGKLEWKGLQGSVWQSATRDHIKVQLTAPGIHYNKSATEGQAHDASMKVPSESAPSAANEAPKALAINDLSYEADMTKTPSGLWASNGSMAASQIEATFAEKDGSDINIAIDNTNFKAEQSEINGLLQISGIIKASSINANGMILKDAVYDIAVENIDSKAMKALQSEMKQIAEAESKNTDPLAMLLPHLPALVNAQPVIKINEISVNGPMGHFALSMKSQIKGQWNDMLAQNPLLLMQMLVAELQAEVPRSVVASALEERVRDAIISQLENSDQEINDTDLDEMVKQGVEQQLASLIAQGYIKEKQTQLVTNVAFNAGQLTVNGQDASPLLGMLMN